MSKYKVLKDTREKQGWWFEESKDCLGTEIATLSTGDYSILGRENELIIERKGSVLEFAGNLVEPRFERELQRLEEFKHPYVFLEFEFCELAKYPYVPTVPKKLWRVIKARGAFLLSILARFELQYRTKFLFVGSHGAEFATRLFKKVG